jgi:hypothetical protein
VIVKFFRHGTGDGKSPVRYLTQQYNKPEKKWETRENMNVLRGNTLLIEQQIDSIENKHKYKSGVLSFTETISPALKDELIDEFEEALLPGLDKSRYSTLWVEHTEHDRTELHFLIPRQDHWTGKGLQPYFHGADEKRINAWKNMVNIEHELADPNDPIRQRELITARDLPRDKKQAIEIINEGVKLLIKSGEVTDRDSLVKSLEKKGFEIARQVKGSISIKDPDGSKNIRLKGAFYERDFRASKIDESRIRKYSERFKQENRERSKAARSTYLEGCRIKRTELEKRYPERESKQYKAAKINDKDNKLEICDTSIVSNLVHTAQPSLSGLDGDDLRREQANVQKQPGESEKIANRKELRGNGREAEIHLAEKGELPAPNTKRRDSSSVPGGLKNGRTDEQIIQRIGDITTRSRSATSRFQDHSRSVVKKSKDHAEAARRTNIGLQQAVRRTGEACKLAFKAVKEMILDRNKEKQHPSRLERESKKSGLER